MPAVGTLNRILTWCEKPFFMLTTEYFHLSCSLQRRSRPQAVRCSTHKPWLSSGIVRGDGNCFWEERYFCTNTPIRIQIFRRVAPRGGLTPGDAASNYAKE